MIWKGIPKLAPKSGDTSETTFEPQPEFEMKVKRKTLLVSSYSSKPWTCRYQLQEHIFAHISCRFQAQAMQKWTRPLINHSSICTEWLLISVVGLRWLPRLDGHMVHAVMCHEFNKTSTISTCLRSWCVRRTVLIRFQPILEGKVPGLHLILNEQGFHFFPLINSRFAGRAWF